jgi:hypothetical protein
VPNHDGLVELDSTYVDRHGIASTPVDSTCVTGLVDPFHYCTTVDLSAKVDVAGLGQKTQLQLFVHGVQFFAAHLL